MKREQSTLVLKYTESKMRYLIILLTISATAVLYFCYPVKEKTKTEDYISHLINAKDGDYVNINSIAKIENYDKVCLGSSIAENSYFTEFKDCNPNGDILVLLNTSSKRCEKHNLGELDYRILTGEENEFECLDLTPSSRLTLIDRYGQKHIVLEN